MIRSLIQGSCQNHPILFGPLLLQLPFKIAASCDIPCVALPTPLKQPVRTTFILKHQKELPLSKMHNRSRRLKGRHFVYDLVEDTNTRLQVPVKVILTTAVEGIGSKYDVVEVRPHIARNHLLLPKLAVYASPENLKKYVGMQEQVDQDQPSSPFALKTAAGLAQRVINVSMNIKNPWKLEPWHVRVAFRKAGINVPEEAITMPSKPIEGPDLSIQNKEFLLKVTINNKEEALVRCRINHTSSKRSERLPWKPFHFLYKAEPLFPEEAPLLEELTRSNPNTRLDEDEEERDDD